MVGAVPQKNVTRLLVGTVPPKSEEVIGRNSPTKKGKRLLVGTVPTKSSEEVIGRNNPTKK